MSKTISMSDDVRAD